MNMLNTVAPDHTSSLNRSSSHPAPTLSAALSSHADQELKKWQQDRKHWEDTLSVLGWLSHCLTLQPVEQPGFTTVSTDGRYLYFCPLYSATLTDTERRFWQAHLIWHCVAGHLYAPLGVHAHRWHLACDHEINSLLLALDVPLSDNAVLFPARCGHSALQVYHWLADHPSPQSESTPDIHPAALWLYGASALADSALIALWRRRAHLAAREIPALPTMVAAFCVSR
jgi:hypothetical protein